MSHLREMMTQVKELKNGVGLKSLIDSAYKILGNPMVMFNTEYNLLTYNDIECTDSIFNEIVASGTFSKQTQRFFVEEGFIEEIASSPKSTLLKCDDLPCDRIWGKLLNKNNSHVANLMIVATNKPFSENDLIIFEIICKLCTREISRNEFYQKYEQAYQEVLINNLIDQNFDKKLDMAQTEILYHSLGPILYVAVVDISHCNQEASAEQLRDLFRQKRPEFKYAVYQNYVVIIISSYSEILNASTDLDGLVDFFEQNNIYAGISGSFENLFDLHKYYAQALKSLGYVLENSCSRRIFPYNINSLKMMQQIEALCNGKGIQYFLNKGCEIFGNPLLFHDVELNLLAYTEGVEIVDPIWQELVNYGTSSDETIKLFHVEGFVNTMENTKGGAVLVSNKIKYDRISWKVYNSDRIMIGCISIVNTNSQFFEDLLVLLGAFTKKFCHEVGEIEFYSNYGQVYSETVINRLLSGKIDDVTFYTMDIGNLFNNLLDNLYLVVVDTTKCKSENINLNYFRHLFNRLGTVNRYAIYCNQIVVIISVEDTPLDKNKALSEIGKVFEQQNIYGGFSSNFEDIYDLQKHYNQAVGCLNYGMKQDGEQRLFQFDKSDRI